MLTVLLEAGADQAALGATLATLVPGAIEGLVREVVVVDRGFDAGTRTVADGAGCRIVPGAALADAIRLARGEWLLLLEPGARLSAGWLESVGAHLGDAAAGLGTPRTARFSRARQDRPGVWARLTRRASALSDGLLLSKAEALARLGPTADGGLQDIARGLAAIRLDATLRPRPAAGA